MAGSSSSSRLSKRVRTSDAAPNQAAHTGDDRIKRRRFSQDGQQSFDLATPKMSQESTNQGRDTSVTDEKRTPWSLSQPVAGQYSNIEPIFSSDEKYLFLATGNAVHIYSTATSILVRTLHMEFNQHIIGYKLCPIKQERLYVFTANGSVRTWEWTTGKQILQWDMNRTTISVDLSLDASNSSANPTFYCLCERKDGKREIRTFSMRDEKSSESVILETIIRVSRIRVASQSQTIIAYGGHHLLLGITSAFNHGEAERAQYTWRETILPVTITCLDISKSARREVQGQKDTEQLDLVVGEAGGSILIYQDALGFFLTHEGNRDGKNSSAARRLHWHRGPVNALRWSRDGNYIISGGNESVLVLWQLDTGRKQFLPHLSSPICNIVISSAGNSYAVKLADNCIMVFSARELQPYATITGLQLSPKMVKSRQQIVSPGAPAAAVLHPQYPYRLLVAVPASRQSSQDGHSLANPVLQTFDIHANTHISRQALARTNTTVLKISPEGSEVAAPDIKYLDICPNGEWMATLDSWTPNPQDIKVLGLSGFGDGMVMDHEETFLKFWKWNGTSDLWELVTRIDGPHISDEGPASVLDLASRPCSNEFVTIGTDAKLRIWCPNPRPRSGLKTGSDAVQQLETWKCRHVIDLKGNLSHRNCHLTTACLAFSEDGSVLAICLSSGNTANPGLVVLIDAQECVVRYSRIGAYCGDPCAVKFLGRQLLIASKRSISVWDTVDDLVRTMESPLDTSPTGKLQQLLAVSSRTRTFAIAAQHLQNSVKKSRSTQFPVKVYDIDTLALVSSFAMGKCPVALLSDSHSGDYIVVDVAASVQRFGCSNRPLQPTARSHELSALSTRLNSGLVGLFGGQGSGMQPHSLPPATTLGEDVISEQPRKLSGIFGEVPSFVLPPASVLFRNVVQSLG